MLQHRFASGPAGVSVSQAQAEWNVPGLQGEEASPWHSLQPALFTNKLAIYCSKEASKSRTERSIYGLS